MDSMDPLSNYNYAYANYDHLPNNGYQYQVKLEQCQQMGLNNVPNLPNPFGTYPVPYPMDRPLTETDKQLDPENGDINENEPSQTENNDEEIDTKENIQLLPQHRKRVPKKKGKTSSYWNKKIEDKNFPFFGCTICNINYTTIQELDEHVTIHKGRLTSYDIRVRNKIKRKEKMKQLKKIKKMSKMTKKEKEAVKKEGDLDVEIKPEDGYIGNEKATDYNPDTTDKPLTEDSTSKKNEEEGSKKKNEEEVDKKKKSKIPEPEDPRLMKLFKCFACSKQFSLSYYLRLHVRSHTDEKPYTCAQCGQSFITASKLGRHTKRIHLAIRFQCRICYRFFTRFDILTRHFDKTHSAEKIEGEPYDFNAILPYLKELEEQLREKNESKNETLKTESIWDENTNIKTDIDTKHTDTTLDDKKEVNLDDSFDSKANLDSFVDEDDDDDDKKYNIADQPVVYVNIESNAENAFVKEDKDDIPLDRIVVEDVKMEPLDEPDEKKLDIKDDGDDSFSDDDYFPSNTWAAPPPVVLPPSPVSRRGRGRGRGGGRGNAAVRGERGERADRGGSEGSVPAAFPMQCEFCEKVISSHSYYKIHLRTHSGERPYKCYICGTGFITSSKMHRHVLTHQEYWDEHDENGDKKVKEEDGETIKEEDPEENGKKKKKKKSKKGAKAAAAERGDFPRYKKPRKRPYACAHCNKRFLRLETLQIHKKCHEGQELVLKCQFCLEVQPDDATLKQHESTHTGSRPYLCTICNRTYTKKETMIYHRKSHTVDEGGNGKRCEYICDVCSKSFNAQCKLQRHLVSHKVEKFVLRYECPVCAHMFHTKYHVNMHLTTHQKEGLILEENRNEILAMVLQNARKIPTKPDGELSSGDHLIAPDERSRVCNICGQVFQHFYYLEEHLKSHGSLIAVEDETKAEENKHICPVCNKGFKLHYYLKLHSFTHSKERPFICQQCGKGFITKGKLKRHLETHTGLKKFQCHICYKFFTRPSYLRIHVRTIHSTQDYNFRLTKQYAEQNSV